jgi:hypothetical protein
MPVLTQAQACSSFCPAAQAKIYNGGSIEQSVGPDGRRYTELATAFAYREKIVPGCTCNGKDLFGLVTTPAAKTPLCGPATSLRPMQGSWPTTAASAARRSRLRASPQ